MVDVSTATLVPRPANRPKLDDPTSPAMAQAVGLLWWAVEFCREVSHASR